MELITDLNQVTPDWLTRALREKGHLERGHVTAVEKGVQRRTPVATVARLQLRYSPDALPSAPRQLFLKFITPGPRIDVPEIGQAEVTFYNEIAVEMPDPPVARCYSAVYCAKRDAFHLLLEDLSETHLAFRASQLPPPKPHCEQIVDALAQVHAYWWDHPRLETLQDQRQYYIRQAADAFPGFAAFLGDRLSAEERAIYKGVLAAAPRLEKHLAQGKNLTLVYEDVHIGNFLYPRDPGRDRIRIVDWDCWGIDVGVADLAHMMAMFWYPERRARLEGDLLRRYHGRLVEYGVKGYTWPDCWRDYRTAAIRKLFIPVWQWSTDHSPITWWNHAQRLMMAFRDLNCAALLDAEPTTG